ncbi:MAG: trypsin-like peptidase domain-containing protein [Clostridia bacterium]|nr:trypsin-like peptidase domain-containing protein [Clostridia bacterium]MBN2882232.1 trypsin-like peptidase domain-containing protein [Clostridia bacterium]
MFVQGYETARGFTHPVIISTRRYDGNVECGLGAFMTVNDEGWIITTAHIFESFFNYRQHHEQIQNYQKMVDEINSNPVIDQRQKKKKIEHLKQYPGWLINHSFWWNQDGVNITDVKILGKADLAVGRLEPFDKNRFSNYPVFKRPDRMNIARSLCKLGYPFHQVRASYDNENKRFVIDPATFPIPLFPIEGMYTRKLTMGKSDDDKYNLLLLETSTPGLRGQSGGPIFDSEGKLWAMQSRTSHHPLGFSPKIIRNGREIEENQFLNTGIGVHGELVIEFLRNNGIKFNLED